MLKSYFKLIRKVIKEERQKSDTRYYEAHHIVPQSFGKKSSTVLLTAEEHYRAHRYLAESFKHHSIYGQKMLWAFHRMTYNNGRKITEKEYAEARELLLHLWKRKKTNEWKKQKSTQMVGNKNGIGNKKNWVPTEEQRNKYAISAKKRQLGKVGEESRASKGSVICENIITGEKIEAGSALQLSKITGVHYSVFHDILNGENFSKKPKPKTKRSKYFQFLQDNKIYYK